MKNCVRTVPLCLAAMVLIAGGAVGAELPGAEVVLPDAPMHPETPAEIVYRLRWGGDEDWRVPAPALEQPEWGQVVLISAATYARGTENVAEFIVGVIASEPGRHELPRVDFEVYSGAAIVRAESAPLKQAPEPWETTYSVSAEPVVLNVVPDYRQWAAMAAVGGVALLLVAAAGTWAYRARPRPVASPQPTSEDPREHVHAARKHRLDGDFYAFFVALAGAAGKVKSPEAAKLAAQHTDRAREVGYGGIRPTDDEMDAALKDTERVLAASRG